MFERFTESARRSLFFARYEVAEAGGLTIEPEHLVLGVLHGAPQAILRFTRAGESDTALRDRLSAATRHAEKVGPSVEIPFSAASKDAIQHTVEEADAAKSKWIHPEHLVLGVLVKTRGEAARALRDAGVDADAVREHLGREREPGGDTGPEVDVPKAGSICRQWTGVVKPGSADAYLAHLRTETLPALARLDGLLQVSILRREVEGGTEFQVNTIWRTRAAIEAFAGADVTRAVVPPAAQALMVRYDDRAVHYEFVQ